MAQVEVYGCRPFATCFARQKRKSAGHQRVSRAAHFSLDSCNENLPEERIHRNCARSPGGIAAPGFLLSGRERGRARRISCEQEKCHAVPKGRKRKSSRTSARGAQSDDQAHAELVGGKRAELKTTGMAKHLWVDREWHLDGLADPLLGNEDVGVFGIIAP